MNASKQRDLSITTGLIEPCMIRVDVADTGCGLPPGVVEHLFEPFHTTKSNSMGIGLAISRIIVEAHYGKIWAEANSGGGAVFSFSLPLVNAETEQ
jgi:signal transduction histidine kinase